MGKPEWEKGPYPKSKKVHPLSGSVTGFPGTELGKEPVRRIWLKRNFKDTDLLKEMKIGGTESKSCHILKNSRKRVVHQS